MDVLLKSSYEKTLGTVYPTGIKDLPDSLSPERLCFVWRFLTLFRDGEIYVSAVVSVLLVRLCRSGSLLYFVVIFDYIKPIPTSRGGSEYNRKLGVTTPTSDYPSQTQYRRLGRTYLLTRGTPLPIHSRMRYSRTLSINNFSWTVELG